MQNRKFKPAKDCIIHNYFKDANHRKYYIQEYCRKNCNYRCLKGLNYKKLDYRTKN